MFPIKRLEKLYEELHRYYLQVITYPKEDPNYQDIATKLSKNMSELEDVFKRIRLIFCDKVILYFINIINK